MDQMIREKCKEFTTAMDYNNYYMIEMAEARIKFDKKENNLCIIDIRSEKAYKEGHIPDSMNFPILTLVDRLEEVPKDRPIFVVCKKDAMSAYATTILRLLGFDATLVEGGVPGYAAAGGTLEPVKELAK